MFGVIQYVLVVAPVSSLQIYHSVFCFVVFSSLMFYTYLFVQQV